MRKKSDGYIRTKNPLKVRLLALWRVLTSRNFILIEVTEIIKEEERGRNIRPLFRTDYDTDSDILTLKATLYYMDSIDLDEQ